MFGNKKNETVGKKNTIIPSANTHSLNSLVHGTLVEGTVKSESDIRIDGTIKGSLYCKSKVIIGPSGFVEGEVRCSNAVIEGRFDGTLTVSELLNVRETARISGDVNTNKLIVQSGAFFDVSCKMGGIAGPADNGKSNGKLELKERNIVKAEASKKAFGLPKESN